MLISMSHKKIHKQNINYQNVKNIEHLKDIDMHETYFKLFPPKRLLLIQALIIQVFDLMFCSFFYFSLSLQIFAWLIFTPKLVDQQVLTVKALIDLIFLKEVNVFFFLKTILNTCSNHAQLYDSVYLYREFLVRMVCILHLPCRKMLKLVSHYSFIF